MNNCYFCGHSKIYTLIDQQAWKIQVCTYCTNAWTEPFPSVIDYEEVDFSVSSLGIENLHTLKALDDLPPQWKKSIIMQIQTLSNYLQPGARILEIGCGEGILIYELQKLGFNVQGVEPGKSSSERARKKGLDVITGYFIGSEIKSVFDAVIFSHVLEHLPKPIAVLKQASSLLSTDGYLLLIQTNYEGIVPRWYKERWYAWSTHEHYWHFTPKGLKYITRQVSLHPVTCEYSSLVHEQGRLVTLLAQFGSIFPTFYNQFHMLLRKVR
jgi:2-polyprenyl-3-methyl-5-hydroxy-6-metoxy-1,4-benzoquinol methylase